MLFRSGNRTTVLAITTVGNDVVSETAWGDLNINENRNTVDGYALGIASVNDEGVETAYTTENLPVYSFLNTSAGTLGAASYKDYDSAKLVDSNGDGRLDCIVVTPVTVAQVATVRPTYIQIRGLATNVLLEKNVVAEGLNAGDFVTYTQNPETEVYTVEKAETVTGVLTATMDATQTRPNQIQVGGTWYTVIENYNSGANLKGMVGAEVELVLAAGYVVNGQRITEASNTSDAVMVVAKAGATTQTSNNIYVDANAVYLEVKILKDDNTTENLKVTKVGSDAVSTSNITTGKLYTYAADPEANGCVILTEYAPYVATDQPTPQSPVFDDKLENSFTVNSGLISRDRKSVV